MSYSRSIFLTLLLVTAAYPAPAGAEPKLKYFGLTTGRILISYREQDNSDLYVIDFEKLKVSPLITTPALEEYGSWSPDATQIVYYADSGGDREIYVADADGSNSRRLTTSKGVDEDPSWSPDGKQIVFSSARTGRGAVIVVMNSDGSKQEVIHVSTKPEKKNSLPRWSPRGDEILFSTDEFWPGSDIMIYEFSAKKARALTSGHNSFTRSAWFPDGSKFAFSYGSATDIDIWFQKKGGRPSQLTSLPGREYDPTYNDDGSIIFFVNEMTKGQGDFQLFMMNVKSKEVNQITEGPGVVRYPSWTPLPMPPPKELPKEITAGQEGT